jgi:hypothetical protein
MGLRLHSRSIGYVGGLNEKGLSRDLLHNGQSPLDRVSRYAETLSDSPKLSKWTLAKLLMSTKHFKSSNYFAPDSMNDKLSKGAAAAA